MITKIVCRLAVKKGKGRAVVEIRLIKLETRGSRLGRAEMLRGCGEGYRHDTSSAWLLLHLQVVLEKPISQ